MGKENNFFSVVFFLFVFVVFFHLVGTKVFYKQINVAKNENARSVNTVEIDWEELYPYDTVVDLIESPLIKSETSRFEKVTTKVKKLSTIGNDWSKALYSYYDIAKLGYVFTSFLTDPSVGSTYLRTKNGYWIYADSSKVTFDNARTTVVPYASLQSYVESKGIDFLYFYAPRKICAVDPQLPNGSNCYTNDNIDMYLSAMDYYGIKYVDLRESIHKAGLDHYSLFYRTDHHWKVETGLWAASEIVNEVNCHFGYSLKGDYDIASYNFVNYHNAEFGSIGQGVTHFVAESEDFVIPYPIFETNYRLEVPNKGVDDVGTFDELFIDQAGLEELVDEGGGTAYGKILYGNPPYVKITNLNNTDGPKILMIRDSFSIVVAPYLAQSCSELVLLDTRPDNGCFNGSIINCINDLNPDIVLAFQCAPQYIKINK